MKSKEAYAKLSKKVSEELSKDGLKERFSSDTMGNSARKIRRVAVITVGIATILVSPVFPYALPVGVIKAATAIQLIGGVFGLGAQSHKKKV